MTPNKKSFSRHIFKGALLVTPWNYLISKNDGYGDPNDAAYVANILVSLKDPGLAGLLDKIQEFKDERAIRSNAYEVVRTVQGDNSLLAEIEYFSTKGWDINKYRLLKLKNKATEDSRAPVLRTPDNRDIDRVPANYKFFARGVKVNVMATMGINPKAGQPYLILNGVQFVSFGISEHLPAPTSGSFGEERIDFDVLEEAVPVDMQIKGSQTVQYETVEFGLNDDEPGF